MPANLFTSEPKEKYIRICEGIVRVKIERGNKCHIEKFPIRNYPSMEAAMNAARRWRDQKHLELFAVPVTEKILHVVARKPKKPQVDPETGVSLPILSAGLSYGLHKGRLLYIVVSHQLNGKTKRTRYPISELGLEAAIDKAKQFRDSLAIQVSKNSQSDK